MTAPMPPLRTHADLAEILNLPVSTVIELRKREGWPHVKVGRAIRFTESQVEQIIETHVVAGKPEKAIESPFGDQTERSARRNAN